MIGKLDNEDLEGFDDQAALDYLKKQEKNLYLTEKMPAQELWQRKLPNASPLAIDLISKLLSFNPRKRLNVY